MVIIDPRKTIAIANHANVYTIRHIYIIALLSVP